MTPRTWRLPSPTGWRRSLGTTPRAWPNGLEHRGLDRVRSHGADGFARTVALSVLAANLHRIGLILQKRERKPAPRTQA